jgi:hypothetical protein
MGQGKLKQTWDSASLTTDNLRVMLTQFLDMAAVVCLQVWAPRLASLRAKTLREIKENMGRCESKERDFKK